MTDIKSLYLPELSEYIKSINEKPFRAKQIYTWLHKDLCNGFDEMTNISKDLREKLKGDCDLTDIQKVTMQESKEDGTRNTCFRFRTGRLLRVYLCDTITAIPYAYLPRQDAGWDVGSAQAPSAVFQETCLRRRCWIRYIRYKRIRTRG